MDHLFVKREALVVQGVTELVALRVQVAFVVRIGRHPDRNALHHLQPESLRYEPSGNHAVAASVWGDSEELRTAISNVLDNAVKYSAGRVEIAVRVKIPDEKHVTLSVRDRGVGIRAEELKRVFKRFYRVSDRSLRHVKGTGLGLFIVRTIARKHGGRVFAESEGEGRGTTVVLELPRVTE